MAIARANGKLKGKPPCAEPAQYEVRDGAGGRMCAGHTG